MSAPLLSCIRQKDLMLSSNYDLYGYFWLMPSHQMPGILGIHASSGHLAQVITTDRNLFDVYSKEVVSCHKSFPTDASTNIADFAPHIVDTTSKSEK
jgi:hypothetical protein